MSFHAQITQFRPAMGHVRSAGHLRRARHPQEKTRTMSRRVLAARISATSIALGVGLAVWALANSYLGA
jgi:hypothetical protein